MWNVLDALAGGKPQCFFAQRKNISSTAVPMGLLTTVQWSVADVVVAYC